MKRLAWALVGLGLLLDLSGPAWATVSAALLPNGKQVFLDSNGAPLAGGDVYFYIPNTLTPKTTWVDPNETTANPNPVVLDSAGRAIIYGSGQYREIVKDQYGNTVWDQLTNSGPTGAASYENLNSDVIDNGAGSLTYAGAITTIASGTTTDIGAAASPQLIISGTTTITSFGSSAAIGQLKFVEFSGVLTLTNGADLILPSGANITTAAGDTAIFRYEGSGIWRCLNYSRASGLPLTVVLRDYIAGLTMSNDGTSPNTVIDTSAGVATSSDNTTSMTLGAFTKSTAAWSAGTGNGCLDTGSVAANTWYSLFVIEDTATSTTDELCSASATSPTMPSGYTEERRIGSFKTNGSAYILSFSQNGNEFVWGAAVSDANFVAVPSGASTLALTVPSGVVVNAIFNVTLYAGSTGTVGLAFYPTVVTGVVPAANIASSANQTTAGLFNIRTNTSNTIALDGTGSLSSTNYTLTTWGWIDMRGSNN